MLGYATAPPGRARGCGTTGGAPPWRSPARAAQPSARPAARPRGAQGPRMVRTGRLPSEHLATGAARLPRGLEEVLQRGLHGRGGKKIRLWAAGGAAARPAAWRARSRRGRARRRAEACPTGSAPPNRGLGSARLGLGLGAAPRRSEMRQSSTMGGSDIVLWQGHASEQSAGTRARTSTKTKRGSSCAAARHSIRPHASCAVLWYAVLCCAVLCGAVLWCAAPGRRRSPTRSTPLA